MFPFKKQPKCLIIEARHRDTIDWYKKHSFRHWGGAWATTVSSLYGVKAKVVHFLDAGKEDPSDYDFVVFSGSGMNVYNMNKNTDRYESLMYKFIAARIPIIGSCYGMQVFCHIHGSYVVKMQEKQFGVALVKSYGGRDYTAYVSHRDKVRVNGRFEPLAYSVASNGEEYIQAVKHTQYPFLGLQHHPEWDKIDMDAIAKWNSDTYEHKVVCGEKFSLLDSFLQTHSDIELL